jgi:hypothetical protein
MVKLLPVAELFVMPGESQLGSLLMAEKVLADLVEPGTESERSRVRHALMRVASDRDVHGKPSVQSRTQWGAQPAKRPRPGCVLSRLWNGPPACCENGFPALYLRNAHVVSHRGPP